MQVRLPGALLLVQQLYSSPEWTNIIEQELAC